MLCFDCTKAKSEVEKMICGDESGELQKIVSLTIITIPKKHQKLSKIANTS